MAAAAQRFGERNPGIRVTWEKRSLQEFADQPIDELGRQYDLLVIDHPWAGFASSSGVLQAMDEVLPADFLAEQEANSVGLSHASYSYGGHQWALALDAATPVASWRPDLLQEASETVPATWADLISLARKGMVAMPSIPQDTLMNFYMLCALPGADLFESSDVVVSPEIGITALEMLRELASLQTREIFDWNPIRVYEAMTARDDLAYCPFAYGYSNYARRGFARRRLESGDVVALDDFALRTTLGGTGLAISSQSDHIAEAAAFARFVADPEYQRTQFVENGGQPGHRSAWTDEQNNLITHNYFTQTLPCLDRAHLRPRFPGSLGFQGGDGAGVPIREYMMEGGDPRRVLESVDQMYRASQQGVV
nr:extracellular solute-binding protein [Microbacterium barkeri]